MSHSVRSRSSETGRRSGRVRLMLQVGAAASVAVLLAACGGQSSTSASGSSAATAAASSAASSAPASAAASSAPASSAEASTGSAAASSSAGTSAATGSSAAGSSTAGPSAAAGGGSGGAPSLVPAPTGDALTAALDAKCAAFGASLNGASYGLSDVKQIADSRGVCRWEGTGLSQPAVLQVDPRVAGSAQTDQQDRELFCADVSEAGAADPQSNRAKRIAQQVRSDLYYYPAGTEADGVATLTTYREGASGADGGISLGCDASYAYETRIYTTAPLTANLSGTSLVAAHRAG